MKRLRVGLRARTALALALLGLLAASAMGVLTYQLARREEAEEREGQRGARPEPDPQALHGTNL